MKQGPHSTNHTSGTAPREAGCSYLPQLDGLRGFAILAVVFHHFGVHPPGWIDWGPVGPSVFFMLSGYLITISLWKLKKEPTRNAWHFGSLIAGFHARRMARVLPLVFLLLIVGSLLGFEEYGKTWPWHLTFLSNVAIIVKNEWIGTLSHLWSLSLQEQFYLLWPLVLLLPVRTFPYVMVVLVLAAAVFRLVCILQGSTELFRWLALPASIDAFATGAFVAWFLRHRLVKSTSSLRSVWLFLVLALASLAFSRYLRFLPDSNPATAAVEIFECAFFGWLLLHLIDRPQSMAARFLCFRPLIYVGRISYGIFIFHTLISVLVPKWLGLDTYIAEGHHLLGAAFLAAVSIAVATASWYCIEQPLNAWIRRVDFSPTTGWLARRFASFHPSSVFTPIPSSHQKEEIYIPAIRSGDKVGQP
ncbi:acyltransferase [soil metagenome]